MVRVWDGFRRASRCRDGRGARRSMVSNSDGPIQVVQFGRLSLRFLPVCRVTEIQDRGRYPFFGRGV